MTADNDILERLRALSRCEHSDLSVGDEAAAEIVRLRGEVERLSGTHGQAPICYGLRVKGSASVVGVLPMKVMEHPPTSREYLERYEEIPLYAVSVRESIAPAEAKGDWPDYVMLRDTKLHDDSGGLGQRIFTTAGAGYQKVKYVRADLANTPQPAGGEAVADAWKTVHVLMSVMRFRPLSASEQDELHKAHVTIRTTPPAAQVQPSYTTGHCENHRRPGGCPMHNLQCGYPECDRKPTQAAHPSACELGAVRVIPWM